MQRIVEREWLDELPPDDVQASQSRRDLKRLNLLMAHVGIMKGLLEPAEEGRCPARIIELGAGDGTFFLRLARAFAPKWPIVEATLVDQQSLVTAATRHDIERLGWRLACVTEDVFDWLVEPRGANGTTIVANLFLHHFGEEQLRILLRQVSGRCDVFAACEPRRTGLSLSASHMLGLIGCNAVTRHDAVVSVQAGFVGRELSALWPTEKGWQIEEREAGLFSHCFVAHMPRRFEVTDR